MINENKLQDLQTGDILLFDSSDHWYDWLVKKWTTSLFTFSHGFTQSIIFTRR